MILRSIFHTRKCDGIGALLYIQHKVYPLPVRNRCEGGATGRVIQVAIEFGRKTELRREGRKKERRCAECIIVDENKKTDLYQIDFNHNIKTASMSCEYFKPQTR